MLVIDASGAGGTSTLQESLTLRNLTLTNGNSASGGAILSDGILLVENCTLVGNVAATGGAIASSGSLAVRNSTISGNAATTGGGIFADGGVIQTESATITDNSAPAINHTAGTLRPSSSTPSWRATTPALRRRSMPPGGFDAQSSLTAGDPLLEPLADNGGPTLTHLPFNFDEFSRSPAIDAGENTLVSAANDQRGTEFERIYPPTSGTIDIGAVEVQNTLPTVNAGIDDQFALENDPPATFSLLGAFDDFEDGDTGLTYNVIDGPDPASSWRPSSTVPISSSPSHPTRQAPPTSPSRPPTRKAAPQPTPSLSRWTPRSNFLSRSKPSSAPSSPASGRTNFSGCGHQHRLQRAAGSHRFQRHGGSPLRPPESPGGRAGSGTFTDGTWTVPPLASGSLTELVVAIQISADVPSGALSYGVTASSSVPLSGTTSASAGAQIVNRAQMPVSASVPAVNADTGFIEQQVTVTNNTGATIPAFQLLVAPITAGVVHENPDGRAGRFASTNSTAPLPSGGSSGESRRAI